jgi:hypothetical protein
MTDDLPGRCSVLQDHVVVRMLDHASLHGRHLWRHGLYRGLVPLAPADALRLVQDRLAKLPGEVSLRQLREHVAAMAETEPA